MLVPTTALFAAIVVTIVGLLIFWSNPRRRVNEAVGLCSLNIAAWLVCWHLTATFARSPNGLFWFKLTCTVGALAPLSFGLVKESIVAASSIYWARWIGRNFAWIIGPILIAVLPFTDAFIPPQSTDTHRVYGWGYYAYLWGLVALYIVLLVDSLRNMGILTGGRRLEIQVWLLGGCILAVAIYVLMALSAVTHDPLYRRLEPLAVLLFYATTAYAITTHRIFDARQIVLVVIEKTLLISLAAGVAYLCERLVNVVLPHPVDYLVTTGAVLSFASWANERLDRLFQFYPQASAARQAAFAAAQRETRIENLESGFGEILKGWGQSDRVIILSGTKGSWIGGGIEVSSDSAVAQAMRQLRWTTPERIARERPTSERQALGEFMAKHELGVLVIEEGPAFAALVGVGVGASRRPFTYPQVTQLVELASIIEGALERAHFSTKVQHTEQLATVGLLGASLAHEIRNPLVSIKTFVQLLPTHHQDAAFREKFFRLIGDEVGRIDQLTEQLLDLASPRIYSAQLIELHPILRASVDLVAAKAAHRSVQFLTDFQASPDRAFTDASAAKQVMLNLCFNAIQAVEHKGSEERWVKIATRNTSSGIEMVVADSGPGIAIEMRSKLFQPFQTTKSTGFGLGLAICSDILANLNASITVDPPVSGAGATFRVTFPCRPLSS